VTVENTTSIVQYDGDGVATVFPVPFRFFENTDLDVVRVTALDVVVPLTLGTDYTVSGAGEINGGSITTSLAAATGEQIVIARLLPLTQETDLRNQGNFFPEIHEDVFDRLTMLIQQLSAVTGRALTRPRDGVNWDAQNRRINNLGSAQRPTDAANLSDVTGAVNSAITGEALARAAGDANLQLQIGGQIPLESSRFSPISWHDQDIGNSVAIPSYKNAWTFGPQITIDEGQVITIGEGSFWTVAEGDEQQGGINLSDYAKKADLASNQGAGQVGFQAAGSSVLRTVQGKLAEYVSVDDFGAVQSTEIDSGPAIQAALDSGATLIGMPGKGYRSNQKLIFKFKGQILIGAGVSGTTFLLATGANDGLLCSGLSGCGVARMKIAGVSNTAGDLIAVEDCSGFTGIDIRIEGGFNGIRFNRINACKLERFVIADHSGEHGVLFKGDTTFKSDVLNLINGEISHFNNSNIIGIHWQSYAHSLTMTNVRVIRGGRGLFTENSSGDTTGNSYPSFLQMAGSEFDFSNRECIRLDCMRDAWIVAPYAHGSATASNIFIGADTVGVRLAIPRSASASLHGIYMAGKAMELLGGHFYSNSQAASGQSDGIRVGATANGLQVVGVISGNENDGSAARQAYGINIEAGASNIAYSGEFGGNVTANILCQTDRAYEVGGTFRHVFKNQGGSHFEVGGSASPVANQIRAVGATTNNPPQLLAQGSDANIDFQLTPKGTGRIRFGTVVTSADVPVTGYVEIKAADGSLVRLAKVN